jgi:hypothetical protein
MFNNLDKNMTCSHTGLQSFRNVPVPPPSNQVGSVYIQPPPPPPPTQAGQALVLPASPPELGNL